MKIAKIAAVVILILASSVLTYIGYYGFFVPVSVVEKTVESEVLVYTPMVGDYKNAPKIMTEVRERLNEKYAIDSKIGFGIYYDHPDSVAQNELRSEIGCIVSKEYVDKLAQVENDFKIKYIREQKAAVVDFPYKGGMSIYIGMMKAYPKLNSYLADKKLDNIVAMMEVYDPLNTKIEYRALLDNTPMK